MIDLWTGIGAVVTGMERHGYHVSLARQLLPIRADALGRERHQVGDYAVAGAIQQAAWKAIGLLTPKPARG